MVNQWELNALLAVTIAAITSGGGQALGAFVARRARVAETTRNEAEGDRSDFESARDVASMRLEELNRKNSENSELRDRMAQVERQATVDKDECDRKLEALNEIVALQGGRYNRLETDYGDLKRRFNRLATKLKDAGGEVP